MPITSDWKITHNGVSYEAGDVIIVMSGEEEQALIDAGRAIKVPVVVADTSSSLPPDDSDGSNDEEAMTPDEFTVLPASKQKEELEFLGIEPGSNTETRIQQYIEWYNKDDEL